MFPISKYKFYITPDNKTIAISTYAGKTVRGVAKTDPRDTFDAEYGKELAAARCALKIAKRREKRANKQVQKAADQMALAYANLEKMRRYRDDSVVAVNEALFNLMDVEDKA